MPVASPVSIGSTGNVEHGALIWFYRRTLHVALVLRTSHTLDAGPLRSVLADPVDDRDRHYGNVPTHPLRTVSDLVPHLPRAELVHAGAVVAPSGTAPVRLSLVRGGKPILDKHGVASSRHPSPGLGPIDKRSPERFALLRGAPEPQLGADAILRLPDDMDFSFYQCAPRDQQCDRIDGGDQIVLDNLHPEHSRLVVLLPSRAPMARAYLGNEVAPLLLECKRVLLDTDRRRITLNWYADIELPGTSALPYLRIEAIAPDGARPDTPPSLADGEATVRIDVADRRHESRPHGSEATVEIHVPHLHESAPAETKLPFVAANAPPRAAPAPPAAIPWAAALAASVPAVGNTTVALDTAPGDVMEARKLLEARDARKAMEARKPVEAPKPIEAPKPVEAAKPIEIPNPMETPKPVETREPPKEVPLDMPREAPRAVYREVPQETPLAPQAPPKPPKAPAVASAVHSKKGAYDRFKR